MFISHWGWAWEGNTMKISVQCEECDTVLSVYLDSGWAEGRCSYCGTEIEVEMADGELVSTLGLAPSACAGSWEVSHAVSLGMFDACAACGVSA